MARGDEDLLAALAGPEGDAARVVLGELTELRGRDLVAAERMLRAHARADLSSHGRALVLVLDELDRVRGTGPTRAPAHTEERTPPV